MNPSYKLKALAAATTLLALTACGGGASASAPAPVATTPVATTPVATTPVATTPVATTPVATTPVATTAALQGIWQSPAGAASAISAVVLSNGQMWSIVVSGVTVRMVKASLATQGAGFGGSGTSYTLGGASASAAVTASVVEKSRLNGTLTVTGGAAEPYALAYQSRYDTPAVLADYAGSWQATLGPGVVSWSIDAAGALSGTRTTGCTYTGQISPRSEQKAVADAAVTEHCAGAPALALSGVALLSADKANLVMLMTSADGASGVAVNLAH